MDEKSKAILAGFTGKRKRSQLAPHRELISKLHQRGCPFSEIVHILSENFNLTVARSTVFRFVTRIEQEELKTRKTKPRKEKPVPVMPFTPKIPPPAGTPDEVRQRIAALKQQMAQPEPETKRFDYNPDLPLHLVLENKKI
jgi:IS30 family transposase